VSKTFLNPLTFCSGISDFKNAVTTSILNSGRVLPLGLASLSHSCKCWAKLLSLTLSLLVLSLLELDVIFMLVTLLYSIHKKLSPHGISKLLITYLTDFRFVDTPVDIFRLFTFS